MKPRQSHECEFSLMCETTFGKEIKPSTKVRNLYSGMVLMDGKYFVVFYIEKCNFCNIFTVNSLLLNVASGQEGNFNGEFRLKPIITCYLGFIVKVM